MLRNLLSNALKYTLRGKVLVGCRRHPGRLSIQIWDTGIGIPASELGTIFAEYHQIGNAARERSLGLGLGLAIVKRLGDMLGHPVTVRSVVDRGSVFAVDVPLPPPAAPERPQRRPPANPPAGGSRSGLILVVEDDPDVRDLLDKTLSSEGHRVATAKDGAAALDLIGRQAIQPDILLLDYTLPNAMDGLQLALALRERLRRKVPAILLTGDTSTGLLRQIARADCLHLDKPVRLPELTATLQHLLAAAPAPPDLVGAAPAPPDLDGPA
jgi:two-component system CheB/CheR fusion protein